MGNTRKKMCSFSGTPEAVFFHGGPNAKVDGSCGGGCRCA